MKITIVSDTHNQHEKLGILHGEVLIHCGDMFDLFSNRDNAIEWIDDWFGRQRFDLILCTGGNHDIVLEERLQLEEQPFKNAVYLQDSEYIHDGICFYGSPWTPELKGHAFFREDEELRELWQLIPENVDVLMTHTPPAGILDVSSHGIELGCRHLSDQLTLIRPQLHCFGHVHASAGRQVREPTTYVNASSVSRESDVLRQPCEVHIRDAPATSGRDCVKTGKTT